MQRETERERAAHRVGVTLLLVSTVVRVRASGAGRRGAGWTHRPLDWIRAAAGNGYRLRINR